MMNVYNYSVDELKQWGYWCRQADRMTHYIATNRKEIELTLGMKGWLRAFGYGVKDYGLDMPMVLR